MHFDPQTKPNVTIFLVLSSFILFLFIFLDTKVMSIMNFRKFYEKYMSWMDKVRNLLDTSTSEKGCYVLSTEASYLISAPRIYHAERHGKVSLFLFVIQKCILFKYHHVQVTLPGGKRYTCYLHRLMKMLEANQYQMENLTVEEWSILPDYLKWIKL